MHIAKKSLVPLMLMMALLLSGCARTAAVIRSSSDINQKSFRLGVIGGTYSASLAEELFPDATLQYIGTTPDGCAAVKSNKVDGFLFDKPVLDEFCRENPDLTLMDETFDGSDLAIGLAKGNSELQQKVNAVLAELREDGTLDDMAERWIGGTDKRMPELEAPENPVGTLRILTEGLIEPFNYISADGTCIGIDVELGMRIAYALGMDYSVQTMNFDALIPALNAGKGDLLICELNITEERKKEILYSDPYMKNQTAVLVRRDRYRGAEETSAPTSDKTAGLLDKFVGTFVTENRWKLFVSGVAVTVGISVTAYLLGTALGMLLCAMLHSPRRGLQRIARAYNRIITGIPTLVRLMVLYYIIFGSANIPAIIVAILGFALELAASLSGIFKTGLDCVDEGQIEAATALGFLPSEMYLRIVFPQAAAAVFDLYAGEFVSLVKATSVVGYIAIMDLTKVSDIVRSRTYQAFFPLIATALIYFGITCIFVALLRYLGRKFNPRLRRRLLKGVKLK